MKLRKKGRSNSRKVLILNADMTPLCVISWKRAMALSMTDTKDRINIIDYYSDQYIRGTSGKKYPLPCIAVVSRYVKKKSQVKFSRQNVFVRDKYTCMYCGYYDGTIEKLTMDHVVSREKWKKNHYVGTPTNWNNIVTCCKTCNIRKDNKSYKEAGMKLLKQPYQPTHHQFVPGVKIWHKIPEKWLDYLPPLYREVIGKIKNPT